MTYEIRGVREGDLPYLSQNLRAADVREIYATHGNLRLLEALEASTSSSTEVLIGAGDTGKPVVIWGIHEFSRESAFVWACATPDIVKYRIPFLKNCRVVIHGWFDRFPGVHNLINFSHAENTLHHRWLEWCGAQLLPEVPWGPLGEPFRPFNIRRTACVP